MQYFLTVIARLSQWVSQSVADWNLARAARWLEMETPADEVVDSNIGVMKAYPRACRLNARVALPSRK